MIDPFPPTVQWEYGVGYCGEACLISAGLYYGQYTSQATVRSLAGSEVRLGVNAPAAAQKLSLNAIPESDQDSNDFLTNWVTKQVQAGYPTLIGVYNPFGDDDEYDHIVMVYQIDSGIIYFTDQGLYTGNSNTPQFYFQYPFSQFQKTRDEADQSSDVYSLCKTPLDNLHDYGLAVTGVLDDDNVTLPLRMTTKSNDPSIPPNENLWPDDAEKPAPISLTLTTTAPNIPSRKEFNLYKYTDFSTVPKKNFNSCGVGTLICKFNGRTWKDIVETITSDQTVVYRAVPITAP